MKSNNDKQPITLILQKLRDLSAGSPDWKVCLGELTSIVEKDLLNAARSKLKGTDLSMSAYDLLNEGFARWFGRILQASDGTSSQAQYFANRAAFFGFMNVVLENIVKNAIARRKTSMKHRPHVAKNEGLPSAEMFVDEGFWRAYCDAMDELRQLSQKCAAVANIRLFLGTELGADPLTGLVTFLRFKDDKIQSINEAARQLGIPRRKAAELWQEAESFLRKALASWYEK